MQNKKKIKEKKFFFKRENSNVLLLLLPAAENAALITGISAVRIPTSVLTSRFFQACDTRPLENNTTRHSQSKTHLQVSAKWKNSASGRTSGGLAMRVSSSWCGRHGTVGGVLAGAWGQSTVSWAAGWRSPISSLPPATVERTAPSRWLRYTDCTDVRWIWVANSSSMWPVFQVGQRCWLLDVGCWIEWWILVFCSSFSDYFRLKPLLNILYILFRQHANTN